MLVGLARKPGVPTLRTPSETVGRGGGTLCQPLTILLYPSKIFSRALFPSSHINI